MTGSRPIRLQYISFAYSRWRDDEKRGDVTSGGPNKARPEVKMQKRVYKGRNERMLSHSG